MLWLHTLKMLVKKQSCAFVKIGSNLQINYLINHGRYNIESKY